jgi:hypothetical protein
MVRRVLVLRPLPLHFRSSADQQRIGAIRLRINEGHFGETPMDGLKVVILASLVGNVWARAKLDAGVIFDASADDRQRRGLELIFTGKAGGWMGQFTQTIRTVTGVAYADISVEVDRSLQRWHVAVPDLVDAGGIALTGPTADPTKARADIQCAGERGWPYRCPGDLGQERHWPLARVWLRPRPSGRAQQQAHALRVERTGSAMTMGSSASAVVPLAFRHQPAAWAWSVSILSTSLLAWFVALLVMADMDQGPGTPLHSLPLFLVGWVIGAPQTHWPAHETQRDIYRLPKIRIAGLERPDLGVRSRQ